MTTNIFKHILVPTDFSPSSSAAIDVAISLAAAFHAELTLLHVWEVPVYPYMEMMPNSSEMIGVVERAATECLAAKLKEVQARLPRAKSLLKMGLAWQDIVDTSKEVGSDLVVIGTHGRRGISHALMGSVAEKVVRLSPVPVLTVRGVVPA